MSRYRAGDLKTHKIKHQRDEDTQGYNLHAFLFFPLAKAPCTALMVIKTW